MKLTPAKRLKQLKQSGWLEFVEFMEQNEITPPDLRRTKGTNALEMFKRSKTVNWMLLDMEYDLFADPYSDHLNDADRYRMVGLSECLGPKYKKDE